ncbi:dolichyl-phosphate-mannose-protein mannosyltransferase [Candida albicans L26]|uniref:Dolichyl-phosphate-mannose--protein mannosyltransferase n=2 Tax=Candida albicans TaxID=5476 RepID=A0A8H6BTV4_CANAX|nr:Dolichyl-phosphate-mannose--protein mannosyltransferase 4 [Candida albicans]KGQ96472.1 dolichyl-phosphate-mannose-protein mannosyltransferase [Candida albicans P37005]KGR13598.1 dolichyl-phosphate-mannose-protein mannosyltransferase [Candida albicans P78048]KGR20958.1 dolichyl-phosphate-mannose-protein mannosyltransferase [Candida albicans P37037]KGU14292.1 dolichyl-phosphate-mannose-protein mannosyltransferase [Candida albicans 19F]KGU15402.1 dolichyl-phosphate-mannose-protein mannosyltran
MSQTLKKRGGNSSGRKSPTTSNIEFDDKKTEFDLNAIVPPKEPEYKYLAALTLVTLLAIYTRFTKLGTPNKVVFDEVHFGKFASYYLERTYFFDLHPPFAKLLIAFVGWLIGYDGKFKFEAIGDSYIENNVPYIAYRSLSAIQGAAIVPIMFLTMKTLGFSVAACLFSSIIVCFDNAQVTDSRLILLDATLILSVALTIFSYSKFSTFRKQPFSSKWWTWLLATGVSLSCVISTKYVGVFTYLTIGIAVIHELWILLDYRKGLTLQEFAKHFFARLWALIIVPFCIYLYWFYLHFAILTRSGPGDAFMSSEFQETLLESPLAAHSKPVQYFDQITIKHKDTGAFLHSHQHEYPLRYEDGRISSNGQQVTCVVQENAANDPNNQWEIVPTSEGANKGTKVYTNDIVRFRHVGTGGYLLTHDVASPLKPTNEEFTVVYDDVAQQRYNETLFRLRLHVPGSNPKKEKNKKEIKTLATDLRILHVDTVVAMWTHNDELLPEWAFNQQEVSGNKKIPDKDNIWNFDLITNLQSTDPRNQYVPKKVKTLPFLRKWWELQMLMFHHNNQLSSEHPFATQPGEWPLALSGVSFYNDNTEKKQIFFIGNIIGFWLEVCFLSIYIGILLADQITRRRNVHVLSDRARSRLYNTLGFLFVGWAAHYLPFFLMNRQKFLHHYLPAHLVAALFSGGLVEFICSNNSARPNGKPVGVNKYKIIAVVAACSTAIIWFFFYFRPLTYGDVYLTPEEVKARQWLDIKLHYGK